MTSSADHPEVWLRGPVAGVPALLQPVAHALLQAAEDVRRVAPTIPAARLWARPGGAASAGFHLRHVAGVVDRLFTYARGEPLDDAQRAALAAEGTPDAAGAPSTVAALVAAVDAAVARALTQLGATPEAELTAPRRVGRAGLPSTVLGLLVHAAEHAQRHVGQLLVTATVVGAGDAGDAATPPVTPAPPDASAVGAVGWIDLTVDDAERVRAFYEAVVGWGATPLDMGGYADHVMTAAGGAPAAGVCHARGPNAGLPPVWLVYVTVADLAASVARATALGGRVLRAARAADAGRAYCVVEDPAGAALALVGPADTAPPPTQEAS